MERRLGVLRLAAARSRHLVVGVGRLVGFLLPPLPIPIQCPVAMSTKGPRVDRMRSITVVAVIRVVGSSHGDHANCPKPQVSYQMLGTLLTASLHRRPRRLAPCDGGVVEEGKND